MILKPLLELLPRPKDERVYLIAPLINSVLNGQTLTPENRETLKEFPTLLKVIEYYSNLSQKPKRVHFTFGPEATVETACQGILDTEQAILEGRSKRIYPLDFNDLNWKD